MRAILSVMAFLAILNSPLFAREPSYSSLYSKYSETVDKILAEATKDSSAWNELAYMCYRFGGRLAGSEALNKAIDYLTDLMKKDSLENVRKEPVLVPHWVRGNEYCEMIAPRREKLRFVGLGRSVGTPPEGIVAEVVVVKSFKELAKRAKEIPGKIVLFAEPFKNYGQAVQYRWRGPLEAVKYGAVATICRSVSPIGMQNSHTGAMAIYPDSIKKIPNGAISAEGVDMIQTLIKAGEKVKLKIYMEAKTLPDALSYNVLGEIKGSEKPDEIVLVGGHIDSWDIGYGAQDDAGGVFATFKALSILKKLGLRAKRTIRVVAWVNEENGLKGAIEYAKKHAAEKHFVALEFDSGVFPPQTFGFKGSDSLFKLVKTFEPLLQKIDSIRVKKGAWGIDAQQIADKQNAPLMNLNTKDDGKYFWYHHSWADSPYNLDPADLNKCVASIAAMAYFLANMP